MRASPASVFKLCKSNINAKPVINNLSASREESEEGKRRTPPKRRTFSFLRERRAENSLVEALREEQGDARGGGGYIIPAPWGLRGFAFENEMRKYRLHSLSRRGSSDGTRGNDPSRRERRKVSTKKRGRRSFDPSLTGPFLASFSLITRIQIIVFDPG